MGHQSDDMITDDWQHPHLCLRPVQPGSSSLSLCPHCPPSVTTLVSIPVSHSVWLALHHTITNRPEEPELIYLF